MRLIFSAIILLTVSFMLKAQNLTLDVITNEVYTDLVNPVSLNQNNIWDDPAFFMPTQFEFDYLGNTYDMFKTTVLFKGGTLLPGFANDFSTNAAIVVYGSDIIDAGLQTGLSESEINYKTEGEAGERIFKVEWKNVGFNDELSLNGTTNNRVSFQFWLYEFNNRFEVRFGPNTISPSDFQLIHDFDGPLIGYADSIVAFQDMGTFYYLNGNTVSPQVNSISDILDFTVYNVVGLDSDPAMGTVYRFSEDNAVFNCADIFSNMVISPAVCNDEGTGLDSGDDTFGFSIDPVNQFFGNTYTISGEISGSGNYGVANIFDGFLIIDGNVSFTITDDTNPFCSATYNITPPLSCSSAYGFVFGCTNSSACNFNPDATNEDGSCVLPDGCTDLTACNYDVNASCDDGTCILPDGCTDVMACNYDANANCDDGTCILPDGCTDVLACNYDADAVCDDGNCMLPDGCTDLTACNYDANANCDDGTCILPDGCTDLTACNYDANATCDDGTCILPDGCTDVLACNYDADAVCDDGTCLLPDGCTDVSACNYDVNASCDDGTCILPDGCTDVMACNYDVNATCDDGTCLLPDGCTDENYCEFDPDALCDDGSCYTLVGSCDSVGVAINDINNNLAINVSNNLNNSIVIIEHEMESNIQLFIYNNAAVFIKEIEIENRDNIDISDFVPGLYYFIFNFEGDHRTEKIIKL